MEKFFRDQRLDRLIFEYTSWGTEMAVQKDILHYLKQSLSAKKFYTLHPKELIIYGPLYDQDINQFHSEHNTEHIQRDVYAFVNGEKMLLSPLSTDEKYSFRSGS
jgi:hypothetical protein